MAVGTTTTTTTRASGGTYTIGNDAASERHTARPAMMPSGTPITKPMAASRVACHAMATRD